MQAVFANDAVVKNGELMQQIEMYALEDQMAPSRDFRLEHKTSLFSNSADFVQHSASSALRVLLSRRSNGARQSFAGRLAYDSEYAATREALSESSDQRDYFYRLVKRCLDLLVASTLLIALLPLFTIIALAIKLDSNGPALYYQYRIGRKGVRFRFYKFRSMVWNAEALKANLAEQNEASWPIFKMRQDPRVTRIGSVLRRFSLDELPQLINVLRGDISLIGPRPLVVPEASVCDERQQMRHSVQPGLICLREISGRSALSFSEWMELDLLYVANRSLLTDLRVLMIAIPVVLRGHGAY